eukprot:COSAG01_NODE_2228_length_8130_cov_11.575395_8_plen_66_part_00
MDPSISKSFAPPLDSCGSAGNASASAISQELSEWCSMNIIDSHATSSSIEAVRPNLGPFDSRRDG